jgi:hypothetical protein
VVVVTDLESAELVAGPEFAPAWDRAGQEVHRTAGSVRSGKSRPPGPAILGITAVLLVVLALVEFLGRSGAPRPPAGGATS